MARPAGFGPEVLARALEPLLSPGAETALCVGLSGGADSAALLAAAVQLARAPSPRHAPFRLRALHVDHGLVAAAPLAVAARALCARLGVALAERRVEVRGARGASLEAAAREARHAAFAAELAPGECLVTAHHREDQAETLLLQLLRGAGLPGLAAMPAAARLGPGWLLRPLLAVPRAALRDYAAAEHLDWHEDPMNADQRFDRAYLRAALWPLVEARWPGAARALARTATHLATAQAELDEHSAEYLATLEQAGSLSVAGLAALPAARRAEVLRYWLRRLGLPPPSTRRLAGLAREVLGAGPDRAPRLAWPGAELRRFHGRLYATAPLPPLVLPADPGLPSPPGVVPLGGLGRVALRWGRGPAALDVTSTAGLELRPRHGGEQLRLERGGPSRPLKDWLREARVPPWTRRRAPLVYERETLVAVLLPQATWYAAERRAVPDGPGLVLEWRDAPAALEPPAFVEPEGPFG
ncbi:MAG: tRNA lysidine(34) synthetase TilS [Proteobacteria bacterium]|nr:tRNA lysidine(34) synthetase TilS [Pseudomonadota bacterium]